MKKMYKRGFYGGKFLPFHQGHQFCIERALGECEEVVVILFYGGEDETACLMQGFRCSADILTPEKRIQAIQQYCRQFENVRFVALDTEYIHREAMERGIDTWDAETKYVMACVGPFQAVYSSEPSYDAYFKRAYPFAEHRLVDVPRIHIPISGTKIRGMPDSEITKWIDTNADVIAVAQTCLYHILDLFEDYLREYEGRELTEFEEGQEFAFSLIVGSVKTQIECFEEILYE